MQASFGCRTGAGPAASPTLKPLALKPLALKPLALRPSTPTVGSWTRPRRSVLFMPASNARALDKARSLPADGLIFDLEDAVAPAAKKLARDSLAASLAVGGYAGRETFVRVNALTTEWGHDDLVAAAGMAVDAILLPKVETANMVHEAEAVLEQAGAPADLLIWCMVETPLGVLNANEIARASSRLGGLVMGTSDLAADLRARDVRGRMPLLTCLGLCILAARANGRAILDGVHLDLADDVGFLEACQQGRDLGFDGKTLIHPKTIAGANAAFGPSADDVAWSHRVIDAHGAAMMAGDGIVLVDGKLIENLHVARARDLLAMADAIARLGHE